MFSFQRARPEAAGGEGVAEAAQVAGENMLRSRVGLCDRAARDADMSAYLTPLN